MDPAEAAEVAPVVDVRRTAWSPGKTATDPSPDTCAEAGLCDRGARRELLTDLTGPWLAGEDARLEVHVGEKGAKG